MSSSASKTTPSGELALVIMAGGSGERFWPVSNRTTPKQLVRLSGRKTLLEIAFERACRLVHPERVFIVAGDHLRRSIEEALPGLVKDNYIAEPFGRNTAACLGLAACHLGALYGSETVMGVLTADHLIEEGPLFEGAIQAAIDHARAFDDLVTIGIKPSHSDTAFGYLELGENLGESATEGARPSVRRVKRFREKPDRRTAEQFLAQGNFFWNSGMFFWRISTLLTAYERYQPEMAEQWSRLRNYGGKPPYPPELQEEVYQSLPSMPIDTAIMERADRVAAVAGRFGWDDVGSWDAIARVSPLDKADNCIVGPAVVMDSRNNIIYSEPRPGGHTPDIVLYDVQDMVVVSTERAILVVPRSNVQGVKNVVRHLAEIKRDDLL